MAGREPRNNVGTLVQPGESVTPVFTIDFAPTPAALAQIRAPNDLDGRRLF